MKRTLLSQEIFKATLHGLLCFFAALIFSCDVGAQTPEEHASHHPGEAGAVAAAPGAASPMGGMPAAGGGSGSGGTGPPAGAGQPAGAGGMMGGGMGAMMDGMMKKMGVPPPKDIYPTLMAVPELSPERRTQVEAQAGERMNAGTVLIGQALDALNAGTQADDYAAMHEATTRLSEGAAQLESGIAARRALAEGRAPRSVALAWFKQEMNLPLATALPPNRGVSPFHLFTMILLVAFALTMVAMYFFKMRRAAALFGRIEANKKSPPPGSAPELAGGKAPSAEKPASPVEKPAAP